MKTNVATPHSDYSLMVPYWTMMKDVLSSQKEVQNKGTEYLPSLDRMTTDQYEAYKLRASFPMFTLHTRNTFIGMVMRKDILTTNVPEQYIINVDGKGTTLKKYQNDLVTEFLTTGRAASFIDYQQGRQAKLLLYPAESILNWRTGIVDGVTKLILVVLRETVQVTTDEFTVKEEFRYRVLTLEESDGESSHVYRQRLFNQDGHIVDKTDIIPTSRHKPLDTIPIEIHGGVKPQYPPLTAIAEQNLNYYRLDADYKHGLHYVALPTPYTTGVDPDDENAPKTIGCSELWYLPDGASAGILEFKGTGLGAIKDAKTEVYDNIIVLSSRILAPPATANETATAANIRNAGETASLAEMIGELSEELTRALNYAVNWVDTVVDMSVTINTDFIPLILSGSDVASYVSSYLKGGMSFHTLFETLKKGELVDGDRRLEDELKDITEEQLQRIVLEVQLAEQLGEVAAKYTPKTNKEPMQQKEGENENKGQNFKEN